MVEVLEDSGGRSPLTIKDLNRYLLPRATPGHPHSTLKSQFKESDTE